MLTFIGGILTDHVKYFIHNRRLRLSLVLRFGGIVRIDHVLVRLGGPSPALFWFQSLHLSVVTLLLLTRNRTRGRWLTPSAFFPCLLDWLQR